MIKYNIKTVNDWLYNSNPIKGMYYNGRRVYRRFVANGQPTPPVFDGKWKATYQDGHVESAECDSSSEIVQNEINLTNLVSVEIGDCVTSIGAYAFRYCTGLQSITIGSSVTSIGSSAFGYCSSLTSVTIHDSVTSIGYRAFQNCYSLASIAVEATTPPAIRGNWCFYGSSCPIYVPSASVNDYKSATRWNEYASRIKPLSEKPQ